ncbi:hypothetical protein FRC07_010426 [Ceratobasidium sp. 392]|nr:hypothetical protein FRC07_010426 [Ceratobasidium sp. 392]
MLLLSLVMMTAVVALVVTSSTLSIFDLPHLTFGDLMMYTNSIWIAYLILDHTVLAPYDCVLRAIDRGLFVTLSWLVFPIKFVYHAYDAKVVRVAVCFLVTLVFRLVKLALGCLARGAISTSRHVTRLLLAQVDVLGFLRTLLAPNWFTYSACVFGRAMIATVWAKTTTPLMSIPSRLLARLSEPWSAPPSAFVFTKIVEKRRALGLRFSKSKKYTKHGINLSYGNLPSILNEQFWDAPEDFSDSMEPLTMVKDARLNDDSNGSPGTASPAFGRPAVLGALEIAQSFNMTDFAASPSPCPIAVDHKDASPTATSYEPSLFDQDAFASASANTSLSSSPALPSPRLSPASPPVAACKDIKTPADAPAGCDPQATAESTVDLQPIAEPNPAVKPDGAPAPSESPAKSETPAEPKPKRKLADKPKSSVKPPPKFKLPVNLGLSRSSAHFKLKDAPQPKSREELPIQPQLYPGVKPCSCECDLDAAWLTSLFGQLKLDSSKPGSNPARIPQDVIMADVNPDSAPLDGASRKRKTRASYMVAESDSEDNQETLEPQPAEQRKLAGRVAARLAAQERAGFNMSD